MMRRLRGLLPSAASALLLVVVCSAVAQAQHAGHAAAPASSAASAPKLLERASVPVHPWQVPPPQPGGSAYFTNLQDGARIETPYLLKFGLSGGWGLAPIDVPVAGKAGHHHLLVNRGLPLDFKQPLPFDAQYIHFGKGQMETVFNAPPGKYTLRLLLADHQHLPHFVYSAPLQVEVTRQNAVEPQSLVKKGLVLEGAGGTLKAPFLLRFHASGFNVAHQVQKIRDSGHFRLTLAPQGKGGAPVTLDFRNGQTEAWLSPPSGDYDVELEFVDNLRADAALAPAVRSRITVQ